jgi:endonuclease/exonuclease/phosphatase family metal-dependent hydrolase
VKKLLIIALLLVGSVLFARDLNDLSFGEEATFEVITWNIEWFPKNGQTTVDYVSQIIESLDVDLIAMQELDDTLMFNQMIDNLDNYIGYYQSGWFAGLAYIYNSNTIEINDIYEIYTTYEYWNAFPRSPMVMDLNFNGENIFVINNHYKCCGDEILDFGNEDDEEYRRYLANELLKEYIDLNLANEKVILVGDLNDVLTDDLENNVFQMILNDADNYLFADLEIAQGNSENWSYPWWPSHIDHILITNELFDDFNNANSDIQTIKIDDYLDGGFDEYYENISDHRPVALKLNFNPSFTGDVNFDGVVNILDVVITVDIILSNGYNELADLNNDNLVNVLDVVQIVNIIIGM